MSDQMIPADAIRAWRDKFRGCTGNTALEALDALLPAPPRPTLADMTPEEREACAWMQADIIGRDEPLVITRIDRAYWSAVIMDRNGRYDEVPAKHVTPRPDLPRMTWPCDQEAAPALPDGWRLADHKDDGRVVVTNPIPASDGRVYYVMPNAGDDTGYDWLWCEPDELTYIDQEAPTPPSAEPAPEVHPGVVVGQPITGTLAMLGISIEAPDGTVVIGHAPDCHPKSTVKDGGTWQSVTGMRTHLYHALGAPDYGELESLTVVRWGKEADQ